MKWSVRELVIEDAAPYHRLQLQTRSETNFLLLEPEEGASMAEVGAIRRLIEASDKKVFVCGAEGADLVGYIGLTRGSFNRSRHCASLAMAVIERHWGEGLGFMLMNAAISWARTAGIRRLELTVSTDNARAIALYEKSGFIREGVRRSSLQVGGASIEEFHFGKLL